MLGEQVSEDGHGGVVLQDGGLTGGGARGRFVYLLLQDVCFQIFDSLLLLLFLCVLLHLVKHSRHLSRSLVDIDSIILFCLLIGEDLHSRSAALVALSLLILYHHAFVLLSEHFPGCDINGQLSLGLFLLLDFCLLIELLLSLLVFFLCDGLHFCQFILLFLKGLRSSFTV